MLDPGCVLAAVKQPPAGTPGDLLTTNILRVSRFLRPRVGFVV